MLNYLISTNMMNLVSFFDKDNPIPDKSSLMILNANFLFDDFMNDTSDVYADDHENFFVVSL